MNPGGVSVFYGALDGPTCLAEMRSSIGGHIVLGRFETTKPLKVLDFSRLYQAHGDGNEVSYFHVSFEKHAARRKFRRQLHRLISQPIVPGHESDYLITQVLAEYLAHVRNPNFDGVLFGSTQREGGINVVLFPKGYSEEGDMLSQFAVNIVADSAELYRTRKIEYDIPRLTFFVEGNAIHVIDDYNHEDED